MKLITVAQVIKLHYKMAEATGGMTGIRDLNLLKSALSNALSTFDGTELYPTVEEKCANICFCLINNHPFIDGNKRVGIYVMLILLEYNDVKLSFTQKELIDLGIGIADGSLLHKNIIDWINQHKI
ncbi:MAG: type II toxin-antitoxin system death-on-curing family toxin [Ruminiclostridium sp.]|nr:type II toxin-antitoxin system death-on-curing family toxin [Ruminiclostridium sp.]